MGRNRPRKTRPKATTDSLPPPVRQNLSRLSYVGTIDYSSFFDNFLWVIKCLIGIALLGSYIFIWWKVITRHPNWISVLDAPSLLQKIEGLIRFGADSFTAPLVVFYLWCPSPEVIENFLYDFSPGWTPPRSSEIREPFGMLLPVLALMSIALPYKAMLILPACYYTAGFFLSGMFALVLLYALHLLWAWSPRTGILPLLLVYYGIKYYALALAVIYFGAVLFLGSVGYLLGLFLVLVSILDSNFRKELLLFHDMHPRIPPFFLITTFVPHKRRLDLWVLWCQ